MKPNKFSEYMAKKRVKSGKTQGDISRRLGYGSAQFLSNFERGLCVFPLAKLKILCAEIGVSREKAAEMLIKIETAKINKGLGI